MLLSKVNTIEISQEVFCWNFVGIGLFFYKCIQLELPLERNTTK